MKTMPGGLAVLLLAAFSPLTLAAAPTADSVMACMRANIPRTLTVKRIELLASDANGSTRTLLGRLYATQENDKLRAMIRISAPADLSGAAYLLRERTDGDEMYVYMPALIKARRITGAAADGSLWGTDLSFSDIKQLGNAFSGGDATLEKDESVAGRLMHVLSVKPTAAESARFNLLRAWVDASTCVSVRIDFYEGQTVRKRLRTEPKNLQKDGAYWYATEIEMSDLKQGSKTRLKVLGVTADSSLDNRLFAPSMFYLGS